MELIDLRLGLKLILEYNLCPIQIHVDSMEVILMLKKGNLLYNPIINNCRLLIARLESPLVHHIYREKNKFADIRAQEGAKRNVFEACHTFVNPPSLVSQNIWVDIEGLGVIQSVPISNNNGLIPLVFVLELN